MIERPRVSPQSWPAPLGHNPRISHKTCWLNLVLNLLGKQGEKQGGQDKSKKVDFLIEVGVCTEALALSPTPRDFEGKIC